MSVDTKLDSVRATNAAYLAKRPLTAVFTGGNSGIGEFTVRTLARHAAAGQGARIYIVGRDEAAANAIIGDNKHFANIHLHFVKARDLSLITDVDRCCDEVLAHLRQNAGEKASIDLLFMTHGDMWLGKRRETEEGIDKTYSLMYYSRLRFTHRFLPLLDAAAAQIPIPASSYVISVYCGGSEDPKRQLYLDDLSVRDPEHYTYFTMREHVMVQKTMLFETLAAQHPNIGFTHIFPGLVITPGYNKNPMPLWFRVTWKILGPVAKMATMKPEESGERMLGFVTSERFVGAGLVGKRKVVGEGIVAPARATTGAIGGGAYSAEYKGRENGTTPRYDELRAQGFQQKAWDHLQAALGEAGEGRLFKG